MELTALIIAIISLILSFGMGGICFLALTNSSHVRVQADVISNQKENREALAELDKRLSDKFTYNDGEKDRLWNAIASCAGTIGRVETKVTAIEDAVDEVMLLSATDIQTKH